jgi:hypothetical protein
VQRAFGGTAVVRRWEQLARACVGRAALSTPTEWIVAKQEVVRLSENDDSNLGLGRGPGADLWAVDPALSRSIYRGCQILLVGSDHRRMAVSPEAYASVSSLVNLSRSR